MAFKNETGLVNFVCIVFEQDDEMLTLLSMKKQMVDCNIKRTGQCWRRIAVDNVGLPLDTTKAFWNKMAAPMKREWFIFSFLLTLILNR